MPGIESSTGGITYLTGDFYDHILNDLFLPAMADTVIYPNALLKRLPRDSTRVEGKNVVFPIHTDDSSGVVGLGADALLPEAGSEAYDNYSFGIRHLYVRMKFDGITMDASKTQLASWLKVLESEAKAKAMILARQRQRMYHNDGSGVLAEVTARSTGASGAPGAPGTLTLQINQGIESPSTCDSSPTQHLKVGQILAAVDPTGPTLISLMKVATIPTSTTITVSDYSDDGTTGITVSQDVLVNAAQTGALASYALKDTAYKNEPMGLAGILSDANPAHDTFFQGIDATANAFHRANILDNGGVKRPLTVKLLDEGWTRSIEIGDSVPTVLWGSFALVREYADLLIADRRFEGTRTFDGGYDAVPYNGVPFLADRDIYKNRIYMPDEADMRMYVMADPQWMDFDGSVYHRLTDKDAYQATMYCRETLGVDTRDKHTLIVDLQE